VRVWKVCLITLLGWVFVATGRGAPLRVAAFNVYNALGAPGTAGYEDVARILERINADVVSLEELQSDYNNLATLQQRLGLPYGYRPTSIYHAVGILSRYPLLSTTLVYQSGMTRAIPVVRVDVPGITDDPWIAGLHLKCCGSTGGSEQKTRATELYYLKKTLQTFGVTTNSQVIIMGDFNLVAADDYTYASGPDGTAPFSAPANADGYFPELEIFKLDLRHAGGTNSYSWRGDGSFPPSQLDHIMASGPLRGRQPASEIYDVVKDAASGGGLLKFGPRPPVGSGYGSDHLPVFADVVVLDTGASSFAAWSGGQPPSAATLQQYAIGGAFGPHSTNAVRSTFTLAVNQFSITAIVRTNDPQLTVVGCVTDDLSLGPWSTNGVTKTNAVDQSGVPSGTARQIFSIPRTNNSQFLRLDAILQ
jgi:endonuclease/exonuclease/phosphatase family metal-dependent hydrolase